jgi:xylulokinase
LKTCVDPIAPEAKSRIVVIGISGQQHGFVPLDENGGILFDVKLWCNTPTAPECAEMTEQLGGRDALLNGNRNLILPGYAASKIRSFKKNKPELYSKLAHILLPHDYLNYFLTGEYRDASGTALLNITKCKWATEIIRSIDAARDLTTALPPLIEASQPAEKKDSQSGRLLRIPEGALVSSGGSHDMMAAIETDAVSPGVMVARLGTSGTIFGLSESPVVDKKENLAAFCSSMGKWLPLLCTMNGTGSFNLVGQLLGLKQQEFADLAGRLRMVVMESSSYRSSTEKARRIIHMGRGQLRG